MSPQERPAHRPADHGAVAQDLVPTAHPSYMGGLVYIDASEVSQHPRLLDEMFDESRLGAVVRGVVPADAAEALCVALESGALGVPRFESEHYGGYSYGQMLIVSPEDLSGYFANAGAMRGIAAAGISFESRIIEVLTSLAGGKPIELAAGPGNAAYSPLAVRVVTSSGSIAVHCENETVRFPAFRHLSTMIDTRDQLSFYVPLRLPAAGGELHVYPLRFGEPGGNAMGRMKRSYREIGDRLASVRATVPGVGVGDLWIFDAGRYYHGVTPVTGDRSRWTLGGFLARSRNADRVYYWS
jgi:hypothetical protein